MQILKSKTTGIHGSKNDHWLTPRQIVKTIGPFDLDPCCEVKMPWRTAKTMWSECGLDRNWKGRVWMNPPYSRAAPWVTKFVEHGNGISLVSAKSADTVWFHELLNACHSFFLVKGRISFYYPDGSPSPGAFLSNAFFAMTAADSYSLAKLVNDGILDGAMCAVRCCRS